jgi:hypothetical protein
MVVGLMKFEYRVAYCPPNEALQTGLNDLGLEGWDLVQIQPDGRAIFKRPKAEGENIPLAPKPEQQAPKSEESAPPKSKEEWPTSRPVPPSFPIPGKQSTKKK